MSKETKIYVVGVLDQDDKPSDIRFLGFDTKAKAEDWAKLCRPDSAVIIQEMRITNRKIKISGEEK